MMHDFIMLSELYTGAPGTWYPWYACLNVDCNGKQSDGSSLLCNACSFMWVEGVAPGASGDIPASLCWLPWKTILWHSSALLQCYIGAIACIATIPCYIGASFLLQYHIGASALLQCHVTLVPVPCYNVILVFIVHCYTVTLVYCYNDMLHCSQCLATMLNWCQCLATMFYCSQCLATMHALSCGCCWPVLLLASTGSYCWLQRFALCNACALSCGLLEWVAGGGLVLLDLVVR